MDVLPLVIAAVLGSLLTWLIIALVLLGRKRRRSPSINKKIWQALNGVWVEHVPDAPGRSISVGRIYYNQRLGHIAFDGTNYTDELQPYCYWTTSSSSCKEEEGFYTYFFEAVLHGNLDKTYYGNGVVFFNTIDDDAFVETGYYVSVNIDPRQMSHSMHKPPLLQHKNAYKKAFSVEELTTILRNARIPLPGAISIDQFHSPADHNGDAAR